MNKKLQKALADLENCIGIQRDCLSRGYMHGMLNGLICAHSIVSGQSANYEKYERGRRKPSRANIRHKSKRLKK